MTDSMHSSPAVQPDPADLIAGASGSAIQGVFHGLLLALPVWIAGGCVTFILM